METDTEEIDSIEKNNLHSVDIPFALREFGEIPDGYVPVYIVIEKSSLQHVADYGLRSVDNRMIEKFPELSRIFEEVKSDWTIGVDRTKCVFAYPKHPNEISEGLGFDPETDVLLEAMIDPEDTRTCVADGSIVTEELARMSWRDLKKPGWESGTRASADSYWRSLMTFREYTKRVENGMDEYQFPEVLTSDIPTSRLRVVSQ